MKLEISIDKKKFLRFLSIVAGIIIFFILFSGTSRAESGSITLSVNNYSTYNFGAISNSGLGVDFTSIMIDSSDYNQIESIFMNMTAIYSGISFATNGKSTTFTITGCGSGGGVATYSKSSNATAWYFTNPSYVTCSPLVLTYGTNIFTDITATGVGAWGANGAVSLINPIGITTTGGLGKPLTGASATCCISYQVSVDTTAINHYDITYNSSGSQLFTTTISKSAYTTVNTNAAIENITGTPVKYPVQGDIVNNYNNNNWAVTNIYGGGIQLNMSVSSGAYTIQQVNLTSSGITPPPTPPPSDSKTGVGIVFDAATYIIGATATISWNRTSPTPFGYQDDIYLIQPITTGSTVKKILVASPTDTGYIKTNDFPIAGVYNVTFERSILGLFPELLASDTATVLAEQASYILVNETVPVGVYTNGTYLYGWNGSGRIVIFQDLPDGTVKEIDSLAINVTCCVEHTITQLFFPEAGNYRVILMKGFDTVKAIASVTAFFEDIIPGANITVSNISLNKNQYTYGEPYTITYQVDSYNYSTKSKRIIAYDPATGANTLVTQVPAQTGSITRTFDSEMFPFSGALEFRLMGLNATGDYVLANVSFTLSKIDTEGYGLDVTRSPICTKETGYFTYYSPSPVTVTIQDNDVTVYSKNLTSSISGKTVPFSINRVGNYEIFLRPANETDVKFTKIVIVNSCAVATTPGFPGQNGTWTPKQDSIAPTCNFWDGWVQLIFGVQGVNDVTRFQFALILIVVPLVVVTIITKSVGSGIAVGFIPYTFFAFLSLSTPCGTYIPTWTVIFIALVIGIKMKWFS